MNRPNSTSGLEHLVEVCHQEAIRRGFKGMPKCLIHDLISAASDPLFLPPQEGCGNETSYWEDFRRITGGRHWVHCARLIQEAKAEAGSASPRAMALAALVLGMLDGASWTPNASQRAQLDLSRVTGPLSLVMLMTGVSACGLGDPRQVDLTTAGLYQAGAALELPPKHHLLLRELYRARRGSRMGDSNVPRGGYHGLTTRIGRLESVCLSEAGRQELFAAKFANDDLRYLRRATPSMERPYALVSLNIPDTASQIECGGCRFESWAKAFALFLSHDLTCHLAENLRDLRFLVEISLGNSGKPLSVWLDEITFEVPEVTNVEPFLTCLPQLLPLFLRLGKHGGPGDISASELRPHYAPVLACTVEIIAGPRPRVVRRDHETRFQSVIFGPNAVQIDKWPRIFPREHPCSLEGLRDARIDFLEQIITELTYAIAI